MIWLLFPAMTHVASSTRTTSTKIIIYHLFSFPIDARNRLIIIDRRISSIILPVMSIDAFILLMFGKIKNTELGLIVEHIKILILEIVMDEFALNFLLTMCIRTKVFISALIKSMWPMSAKAFPIRLNMILFFNRWMTICTVITVGTINGLFDVGTHCLRVEVPCTTTIFLCVIVNAMFVTMLCCYVAWVDFEDLQVKLLPIIKLLTLIIGEAVNL